MLAHNIHVGSHTGEPPSSSSSLRIVKLGSSPYPSLPLPAQAPAPCSLRQSWAQPYSFPEKLLAAWELDGVLPVCALELAF